MKTRIAAMAHKQYFNHNFKFPFVSWHMIAYAGISWHIIPCKSGKKSGKVEGRTTQETLIFVIMHTKKAVIG